MLFCFYFTFVYSSEMILIVGLVTTSPEKLDEFTTLFSLYGHSIEQIEFDNIESFLRSSTKERRVKGVVIEKSSLIKPVPAHIKSLLRSPLILEKLYETHEVEKVQFNVHNYTELEEHHLELLWHYSEVMLYMLTKEGVIEVYKCSDYVRGYINKSKYRTTHTKTKVLSNGQVVQRLIYGWDSVFCNHRTGMSTLEYDESHYKVSARQNNISKITQKLFHYAKNTDLYHNPQHYTEVIAYHTRPFSEYIKSVPEFCPTSLSNINTIINNICTQSTNQGAFFRSSKTRRHNGWCPGLNMGIPFTEKKKDRIHELAYQFHDFSHFNIPDLVFTGNSSEFHRFVYITYRLMSEALTLVLADMIFVNSVFVNGGDYATYEGRKIYPIFKLMLENNPNYEDNIEEFIKTILYGSVMYCFFGDMSIWEGLCGQSKKSLEVLANFKDKYDSYFTADMYWTAINYDNMKKYSEIYKKWWKFVHSWRTPDLELQSIDEFVEEFQLTQYYENKPNLIKVIFESVYKKYVQRLIITTISPFPSHITLLNSHLRYMMGQSLLFFRYDSAIILIDKFELIAESVRSTTLLTPKIVETVRNFYNMCLDQLKQDGYINADDVISYKDVFPPFFVPNYLTGYENFSSGGKQLKDFQSEILHI